MGIFLPAIQVANAAWRYGIDIGTMCPKVMLLRYRIYVKAPHFCFFIPKPFHAFACTLRPQRARKCEAFLEYECD
ncbi:MAG: hypothetical protein IJT08_02630 [Alphaproteobacteria bacterium]|nr:hypothetical protein [Alphaproteobacteria bacterium]